MAGTGSRRRKREAGVLQEQKAAYQETARACFFLKEDPWGAGAANNGFHPTRAPRGAN